MREVYPRCAGMDVHKASINVCVRIGKGRKIEIRRGMFGTFTQDLERLAEFLREHKVRRVVMESTGVYWMPVWNVLERSQWQFDLVRGRLRLFEKLLSGQWEGPDFLVVPPGWRVKACWAGSVIEREKLA